MSSIFGGSKSRSRNTNRDVITNAFSPLLGQAVNANNRANAFLSGDTSEFDAFKRGAGYDFELMRGMDQLGSSFSGRNVFRSGARDKATAEFGANINNRFAQQYLNSLLGLSGQSMGAGQLVAGVGQESTSRSKPGIGGMLGGVASGIASNPAIFASDERLKKNIEKIGETSEGLGIYRYDYIDGYGPYVGVMAQEVAELKPEALGPTVAGYMTVDYSKIEV